MKRLTHEQYIINFKNKQPELFNNLKIHTEYINRRVNIIVEDKYGLCEVNPDNLLRGHLPSIIGAIDKTEYLKNKLKEKYGDKFNYNDIKVEGDISKNIVTIVCNTCNKEIKNNCTLLLSRASCPRCSNKEVPETTYFIENLKIKFKNKDYDYSKVIYKNSKTKVKLFCNTHKKEFYKTPNDLNNGQGCPLCGKEDGVIKMKKTKINNYKIGWGYDDWFKAGQLSKNFDSYKLYIIQCIDANKELFYKIGKTYKKLSTRLTKGHFPYNYLEILVYHGEADDVSYLEKSLQKLHKNYKYVPEKKFGGMYECFSQINLEEIKNILFNVGRNSCC